MCLVCTVATVGSATAASSLPSNDRQPGNSPSPGPSTSDTLFRKTGKRVAKAGESRGYSVCRYVADAEKGTLGTAKC